MILADTDILRTFSLPQYEGRGHLGCRGHEYTNLEGLGRCGMFSNIHLKKNVELTKRKRRWGHDGCLNDIKTLEVLALRCP